jgi:hypothetical protein
MALMYAHGARQWLTADSATTTYVETCTDVRTGQTFRPKAIKVWTQGLGSGADANSTTAHFRKCIGFATSATNRRCVASQDQDAAGTQVCTAGQRTDAVAATVTSTPAFDGLLDIQSFDAAGFTFIVDDASPVDITVFWEAWGGDDSISANVVDITEPGSAGNQTYSVGFQPSVLMIAGCQHNAADGSARQDSGICLGFATSDRAADNVVILGNSDDASGTSDCDAYCQTGECLAMIAIGGGNATARAKLANWTQDGFVLNWIARATTNRRYIALAISGGQWQAGAYTIAGNSGSATETVSGLPFVPLGVSTIGVMTTQPAAGTSGAQDRMGIGCGSSTTSRRSMGGLSQDGQGAAALVNLTMQYDQVLCYPDTSGGVLAAYDIDAMLADGFRIIVDTAGGVANEWQGYLAFGGKSPTGLNNYQAVRVGNGMGTGERIR